jgi:hypothetical protein
MTGSFTTGLGAQIGLAAEATYGTYKAPNRFFEFTSEGLNLSRGFVLSSQLRAGRMYQSATRRTATTRSASGPVAFEVPSAGFGPWLNLIHGETVVPAKEGATSMYKQVHNIGTTDPFQKSATVQVGRPNTAGTVDPYSFPGSIATALEFSLQTGGLLECTATLDNRNEVTSEALATASYPTGLESFNFVQAKVKVGGSELTEARGVTITLNGPRDTSRFYLGAELKAVPLTNAFNGAALSLTVDYGGSTLYNFFAKAETPAVEVIIQGVAVEAIKKELKFVFAACGLDGDSPNVSGPGILGQTIPIVVLDNATNPPVVATYVSADSTL